MRGRLRLSLVVVLAALVVPATAVAHPVDEHDHGDHPGRYIPSPESTTQNIKLLSSIDKTQALSTYRNSDLAFWGRLAFAGNYEGFRIIDVSDPEAPLLVSDVICPGAQHDISVWGDLAFLSVDAARTGPDCSSTQVAPNATGFEGIRIFDVSDPSAPVFVDGVPTDCGSHTHTLLPDPAQDRVLLYVSSYPASHLGQSTFGNECHRLKPDGSQGHSKISIVSVPLDSPSSAEVIAEPGFELRDFNATPGFRGCHDIQVFLELEVAAAACMTEGQIWDISNPLEPRTTARVFNTNIEFWHSAAFTWDGRTVLFGDEAGGGTGPRCRQQDPNTLGAIWFYDVASLDNVDADGHEAPLGSFKVPRVQGDAANCTMHNFNVVPVRGRYIGVSSAYAAGTSVFDFSDPANAVEIAHFDPHGANTWSSYWYNNFIYTNDSGRGVDILLLSDAARAGAARFLYMNPQTQESVLD